MEAGALCFSDSNKRISEMEEGKERSCFPLFQKPLMSCGALQRGHWAVLHRRAPPAVHSLKRKKKVPWRC